MKAKLLFTIALVTILSSVTAQEFYNEDTDGDLSDDGTVPSGPFVLEMGTTNTLTASQAGNPRDVDFFTITIQEGQELQQIIVNSYNGTDNVAFIAIDSGATTDVDFSNPVASTLLGGATYGTASVGNDILPVMGNLSGAEGFTTPLGEGDYTFWLNQTGGISEVELSFVVDQTLSVDDNQLTDSEVTIFPNPAQNTIQISSNHILQKIVLFDILGKEVKTVENGTNTNNIDISQLTSGLYLAKITTQNGSITRRVIKQ